jgi:hypothetical protein
MFMTGPYADEPDVQGADEARLHENVVVHTGRRSDVFRTQTMAEKRNETLNVGTAGDIAKGPSHFAALTRRGSLFLA